MNIFFTDKSPLKSAQYLDTKRVIKMILESCQMLATAINENDGVAPYKSTHKNHPSNVWSRESYENWNWLWYHMVSLQMEYKRRRGKVHKSFLIFLKSDIKLQARQLLPSKGLTKKPNCAANESKGVNFKHVDDIYDAYKQYLCVRWEGDAKEPTWK